MRIKRHNALIAKFLGFVGLTFGITTFAAADGQTVYNNHCAICHATGVSGAPKTGDVATWKSRGNINQLLQVAISGKAGTAMAPKGGCNSCSNDDLKAAIEYMMMLHR
ncbi:MAG: c-type cytochrome [Rickettsiales bacterium]